MPEAPRIRNTGGGRFVKGLQTDYKAAVSTVVAEALHKGTHIPLRESILSHFRARKRIKMRIAKRHFPDWANPEGFIDAAQELNSSRIWEPLLRMSPGHLRRGMKRHILTIRTEPAARRIATNNAKFVTSRVTQALFAIAMGETASLAAKYKPSFLFMGDIGTHYDRKAQTPEEFIERLRTLVPNPDIQDARVNGTLLNYLISHNMFDSSRRRCPAIPLTRLILEQWGRQIDTDPVYRERLTKMITRRGPRKPKSS